MNTYHESWQPLFDKFSIDIDELYSGSQPVYPEKEYLFKVFEMDVREIKVLLLGQDPYGVAKLYSYWIVKNYRESYGMFTCNGILFNHEGVRRGYNFVTRKVTLGLSKILRGETDKLIMGNIDSLRDWGNAKDFVEGMWMILQHDTPDDYVLATGEMHSVREFIEIAFKLKGFEISWKGEGVNEIGYDTKTGKELIFIDSKYFRPAEVEQLLGDYTKATNVLGWRPKTKFIELVKEMVDHDCN